MLPVMLDLACLPTLLIGDGAAAEKRLRLLDEAEAARLCMHALAPSAALTAAAGARLVRRLPSEDEIAAARLVLISDRTAPYTGDIAARARAAGALVHIEDDPDHSDLHMTAVLRRGDLTIAVSTGGASPGLAVRMKEFLAALIGPEWRGRTAELAKQRGQWRADGAAADALRHRTEDWLGRRHWLPRAGEAPPRVTPHS
jgi:precorrin-2 dehydrogenase / sirohydrochlorin ferrochelatase